ncbi:hypothetical protein P3W85_09925 [Cupriavidus basilensis]|uniref:Uncharacterized protein n=1 Tax=Cupriavidus basilensis TaxID=68895 RepID=A0ABT6ANC7_9BURK|nr:hypothetical protein [Cupriavidus basilensis]MDF3833261.1 hypothetical protein [Cupriavidus basilensis]
MDSRQPLQLTDAILMLEQIRVISRHDSILAIAYDPGYAVAGGRPFKPVVAIHPGFDWDAGRVFLDVGPKLMAPNEDLQRLKALVRDYAETIGYVSLALRDTQLGAEAKLQAIDRTIASLVQPTAVSSPQI